MTRSVAEPFSGFSRILISKQGDAIAPAMAVQHGISPSIAFLRDDGWVLGAPRELEFEAYRLWPDKWVGFCRTGEKEYKPMSLYGD